MPKYLITGGLGFLGQHVVKAAIAAAHTVTVADNLEPRCGGVSGLAHGPRYAYRNVDITDFSALQNAARAVDPDVILHLAAYGRNLSCRDFPDRAKSVNVGGTLNVLMAAALRDSGLTILKNRTRVVVCSSNITLSDQDTVYKFTKQRCELLVEEFARGGLSVMGLRPSNIYGVGQSRTEYQPCAFAGMDMAYEREGYFSITGDGSQTRDFTHADDVADAFLLAANSAVSGCTVDIATGVQTSMNEVAKLLGAKVVYADPRPGDAKTLVSNIEPAKALLGFTAKRSLAEHIGEAFPSVQGFKVSQVSRFQSETPQVFETLKP
jgi:UDP-glucose 4-epimerase